MANPITWRNVNSRPDNVAANLLGQASDSINASLRNFDQALGNVRDNRQAEHDHTVNTNTRAFLDEIGKYRTPEALQEAQQAGVFENLLSGFGGKVNNDTVRNAIPQALQTLQQRTLADNQYTDNIASRENREPIDAALALAQAGRVAEAKAAINALDTPNTANLLKQVDGIARERTIRDRQDHSYDRQLEEETRSDVARKRAENLDKKLGQVVENLGNGDDPTATVNTFIRDAIKDGSKVNETLLSAQALEQALIRGEQLSDPSKVRLAQEESQLVVATGMQSNPFYVQGGENFDPQQAAADIINRHSEKLGDLSYDERSEAVKYITQALNGTYSAPDGSTITQLPPAIVEIALSKITGNGWWTLFNDDEKELERAINATISESGVAQQYGEYLNYKNLSNQLKVNALKAAQGK